jgi:preprotein translocase subunit SecG
MGFIIGLLTIFMVLDCLVLILLILVQLPKKDAGAGMAFGGAATDALFGAGKGNVLTNITKYAAILFFAFAIILSVLQSRYYHRTTSEFERSLTNPARPAAGAVAPATAPATPNAEAVTPGTNAAASIRPGTAPAATNAPVK